MSNTPEIDNFDQATLDRIDTSHPSFVHGFQAALTILQKAAEREDNYYHRKLRQTDSPTIETVAPHVRRVLECVTDEVKRAVRKFLPQEELAMNALMGERLKEDEYERGLLRAVELIDRYQEEMEERRKNGRGVVTLGNKEEAAAELRSMIRGEVLHLRREGPQSVRVMDL